MTPAILLIAVAVIVIITFPGGPQPPSFGPTRRQRRQWKRERADLSAANRRRA